MAGKKRKKQLELIGWDGARGALSNGWSYTEDQLVRAVQAGALGLTMAAPYAMEVLVVDGKLAGDPDPGDPRPAGIGQLAPIPEWIKPSKTGDPAADRSRA